MLLPDKVTIVSGIGPGLGQHLALVAAAEGAKLAVCARTPSKLDDVAAEIGALGLGTEVLCVPTDIQDRDQCKNLVDQTMARYGRIDVLVNSAYTTGGYGPAETADLDEWRAAMDINLYGTMTLIQEVVPHMKSGGGGSIVNVNTKVARMPQEGLGGYAVSKAALRMATTQLAKELGSDGIRVNSIFPGWMWGETVRLGFEAQAEMSGVPVEEIKAEIAQRIPLGEIPEDSVCAKAVIALASEYFAAVTGACLDASGGEYMPV